MTSSSFVELDILCAIFNDGVVQWFSLSKYQRDEIF